jgi:hypothetical protein
MAVLYQAQLDPTKLELLTAWLPSRAWFSGPADVERVGAFRFDDPAGEVGIETMLVRAGDGPLWQVPLTYRGAPFAGRDEWLVGTTEHSVLGRRWVYDGCGDPAYVEALATTIRAGARQAEEFVDRGGQLERREPSVSVLGSGDRDADRPSVTTLVRVDDGDPTLIVTDVAELTVVRVVDPSRSPVDGAGPYTLRGSWTGQSAPLVLAYLSPTTP